MSVHQAKSAPTINGYGVKSNSNTHGNNSQHGVSFGVFQQDVDEGNDL